MIITQKYNSASEIDTEFIPSLEDLLSECVPNFNHILDYESSAPEDTNFAYYLFFGNKKNSPIGFAQLEINGKKDEKVSWAQKLFKKNKKSLVPNKKVKWLIPGSLNEGVVFDPMYISNAKDKTRTILTEYNSREDVLSQSLIFSQAYQGICSKEETEEIIGHRENVPDTLVKNKRDYQSFHQALPSDLQNTIKNNWKIIQRQLQLKMGDYSQFKEVFQYKEKGAAQYKELKSHPIFKKYTDQREDIGFLTLENDQELMAIIVLIKGKGLHCFYDFLILNDNIPAYLPHQMTILKFYERSDLDRLHYLGDLSHGEHLKELGFTVRNQFELKSTKEEN